MYTQLMVAFYLARSLTFNVLILLASTYFNANNFTVILHAMKEDPPLDIECHDEFLVQFVIMKSDEKSAKTSIQKRKIQVNFLSADSALSHTNEVITYTQQLFSCIEGAGFLQFVRGFETHPYRQFYYHKTLD